jgi:hypothetical protein
MTSVTRLKSLLDKVVSAEESRFDAQPGLPARGSLVETESL